jgi:hypothetical protein
MIDYQEMANAIYRVEGSDKTKWPYGIMQHYKETTPRQACINTIRTVAAKYQIVKVDQRFIYLLADKYCPPSADREGNERWKHNMIAILHVEE